MFEKKRIYSIQFLRFAAAVAVVCHHILSRYDLPITVGSAGVDIFFIISGTVIGLAFDSKDRPYPFAIKRFIRVMPLYWLGTLAYAGFRYYAWKELPTSENILRSFFLWPIFGTQWHPIYYPGWTLEFEMFFYMIAAVILSILPNHAKVICIILFASLASMSIQVPFASDGTYFETQFLIEFCAGLLLSYIIRQNIFTDRRLGLAIILAALLAFAINHKPLIDRTLAWGLPALMLMIGLFAFEKTNWLRNKFLVLGGEASYALYLTHITTIDFLGEASKWRHIPTDQYPVLFGISLFVSAIAIGFACHLFLERPLLKFLRHHLLHETKHNEIPA